LNIAVNLSARQFGDEHLLSDIAAILQSTGMDAHLLELEVAENVLIRDVPKTLQVLTALKSMGIRIAIDDFGVGYSSLSTLRKFPLDTIKIDRSCMREVGAGTAGENLTDAIVAMGRALSLTVVAQGVETREQADFLRTHACDELQGFYFSMPVPADEATGLLLAQASNIVTYIGTRAALKDGW
jgi:EAL domain-containing protein (putative c-di-GMP-specific phosphodiesterase class I)